MKRMTWMIGAFLLLGVLAGCGPKLQAVREFSSKNMEAEPYIMEAVNEGHLSCQRTLVVRTAEAEAMGLTDKPPNDYCTEFEQYDEQVVAALKVFFAYVEGMGMLAADDSVSVSGKLKGVSDKLGAASKKDGGKIFNSDQVGAVASLVDLVLNAAVNLWKKAEINKYLKQAGPDVEILLSQLSDYLSAITMDRLQEEKRTINEVYDLLIPLAKDEPTKFDFSKERQNKLDVVEQRIKALNSFIAMVESAQATHTTLVISVDQLDADLLKHYVTLYTESVEPAVDNIKQAFKHTAP